MGRILGGLIATVAAAGALAAIPTTAGAVIIEEVCFDRSDGFPDAGGMSMAGSAEIVAPGILRLTRNTTSQAGIAFAEQELNLTSNLGFDSTFQFRMHARGGIGDEDGPGADGIAFIFENAVSPTAGGLGGGIGYHGLPNSLAIEFDTYRNTFDPNGDHISIHTRGTEPNNVDEAYSIGRYDPPGIMADGAVHTARIRYLPPGIGDDPGLTVFYDGAQVLHVDVDLATLLDLEAGNGYVGLSAATGAGFENHDILNWTACTSDGRDDPVADAVDDAYTTDEDTLLSVAAPGILGNDTASGRSVSHVVTQDAAHGTLDVAADGSFSYQPDPDFAGTDSFTYRLCAEATTCDTATVTITVSERSAPTALTADPAIATIVPGLKTHLVLSARLTSGGAGVAGQRIRFVVGGATVCSDLTDATGVAQCGNTLPILLQTALRLGYDAVFDATPDLHASSAHGPILRVGASSIL